MFELYDVVKLKRAIPGIPLPVGSQGTIVIVHDADPPAYEVEFPDAQGANGLNANEENMLGLYNVLASDLEEGDNSWKDVKTRR